MYTGVDAFVAELIETLGVIQFKPEKQERLTVGISKSAVTVIVAVSKQLLFNVALTTYIPASATLILEVVEPPLIVPFVVVQLNAALGKPLTIADKLPFGLLQFSCWVPPVMI